MKRLLTFTAITFLFFGCKEELPLSVAGEKFIFLRYPNEQACLDSYSTGGLHCLSEIFFEDNERVTILDGDFTYTGHYAQAGKMILVELKVASEPAKNKEMKMVLKDPNSLQYEGREWRRYKGPTPWDLY